MLNLWIGLCRRDAELPTAIHDAGYRDHEIEREFKNQAEETVAPELIAVSETANHSVMFEWKSGKNVNADQLRRYAGVTTQDLIQRAQVSASGAATVDAVLIGEEDSLAGLQMGVAASSAPETPLLVRTATGLRHVQGDCNHAPFKAHFTPELMINWDTVPRDYVPIDPSSSEAEIAEVVSPLLVAEMMQGAPRIEVAQIAKNAFPTTWSAMGKKGKKDMQAVVVRSLEDLVRNEFKDLLSWHAVRSTLSVDRNRLVLSATERTRALKQLGKMQKAALERLSDGQMSIFDFSGE